MWAGSLPRLRNDKVKGAPDPHIERFLHLTSPEGVKEVLLARQKDAEANA